VVAFLYQHSIDVLLIIHYNTYLTIYHSSSSEKILVRTILAINPRQYCKHNWQTGFNQFEVNLYKPSCPHPCLQLIFFSIICAHILLVKFSPLQIPHQHGNGIYPYSNQNPWENISITGSSIHQPAKTGLSNPQPRLMLHAHDHPTATQTHDRQNPTRRKLQPPAARPN